MHRPASSLTAEQPQLLQEIEEGSVYVDEELMSTLDGRELAILQQEPGAALDHRFETRSLLTTGRHFSVADDNSLRAERSLLDFSHNFRL